MPPSTTKHLTPAEKLELQRERNRKKQAALRARRAKRLIELEEENARLMSQGGSAAASPQTTPTASVLSHPSPPATGVSPPSSLEQAEIHRLSKVVGRLFGKLRDLGVPEDELECLMTGEERSSSSSQTPTAQEEPPRKKRVSTLSDVIQYLDGTFHAQCSSLVTLPPNPQAAGLVAASLIAAERRRAIGPAGAPLASPSSDSKAAAASSSAPPPLLSHRPSSAPAVADPSSASSTGDITPTSADKDIFPFSFLFSESNLRGTHLPAEPSSAHSSYSASSSATYPSSSDSSSSTHLDSSAAGRAPMYSPYHQQRHQQQAIQLPTLGPVPSSPSLSSPADQTARPFVPSLAQPPPPTAAAAISR